MSIRRGGRSNNHLDPQPQPTERYDSIHDIHLLPINPTGRAMTKEQWLEFLVQQHDLSKACLRRRDEAIVRAVAAGAKVPEITAALRNRIGGERVRQIVVRAGIKPSSKRGPKPGKAPPIPKKSGLSHLQNFER
jgi:hypothetical protein